MHWPNLRRSWFPSLALAVGALLAACGAREYCPWAAVVYADSHWRWTEGSGCPGPFVRGGRSGVARLVPGPGWFQPDFECAEFVGRALAAGGIPVPVVPPGQPGWVTLVNTDHLVMWLLAHGWAVPAPPNRLRPGDVVLYRYPHPQQVTYWSHMALVVEHAAVPLVDAHNRSQFHVPWTALTAAGARVEGLRILMRPRPLRGRAPRWPAGGVVEVVTRDVPWFPGARLETYLGAAFVIRGTRAAAGTVSGWAVIGRSGRLPTVALRLLRPPPPALPCRTLLTRRPPALCPGAVVPLGLAPDGHLVASVPGFPRPGWAGPPAWVEMLATRRLWQPIRPTALTAPPGTPLYALPTPASLVVARWPAGARAASRALVRVGGRTWWQVDWWGATTGIAYVAGRRARFLSDPVRIAPPGGALLNRGATRTVAPAGMALAMAGTRQVYWGGQVWRLLRTQPKRQRGGPKAPGG
jgi:hypothetical protein